MHTFQQLSLVAPLQRALDHENYQTPTPIQAQTIPPALEGRDILGCAQTGTGKTAAFALPILHRLALAQRRPVAKSPNALVLAPTRELASQIGESFDVYARHLKVFKTVIYGGVSQVHQVRSLQRGVHVAVATPGRLLDLMTQGHIDLRCLETFVLDEADRMLDMGFLPDLKRIISRLPRERQSLFFSATLPPSIVELSQSLLHDPVVVNVTPKKKSVSRIRQEMLLIPKNQKQPQLEEILTSDQVGRTIVFTRTKRTANLVERKLRDGGFRAAAIHGNKSQNVRQRVLQAFRGDKLEVLVATDVAARGIDVDGVTHVVNYDLPTDPESYVHRIGRTGRAGADGVAITFCTADQRSELREIEKLTGKQFGLFADAPRGKGSAQGKRAPSARGRKPKRTRVHQNETARPAKRSTARPEGFQDKQNGRVTADQSQSEGRSAARRRRQRPGRNARKRYAATV